MKNVGIELCAEFINCTLDYHENVDDLNWILNVKYMEQLHVQVKSLRNAG